MQVLLSDTVGFVRNLPHTLVASFKATLEEAVHADLLLHVLDVGHPHAHQQFDSVHQVLEEVGTGEKPELLLLNKIDTPEGEESFPEWRALYPGANPHQCPHAKESTSFMRLSNPTFVASSLT